MKRQLVLENGAVFVGEGFGSDRNVTGQVVFTTGMTGYQELLSNPSYCGLIVTFTYPIIGSYGINRDDFEGITPALQGIIVKEVSDFYSNFRSEMSLNDYLKNYNIPGISGIDTRKLTRMIRDYGTLKGTICSADENIKEVLERLRATELRNDLVKQVSTKAPYPSPGRGKRIVLIDFGMKHGILRELNKRDCDCIVVPFDTTAEEILAFNPDGVFLSNGPGNPKHVQKSVETIRNLLGKVPIFGTCLGHQLFALACGADTKQMKFGHRGSNHPVKELKTGKVFITSQNHGYVVDMESIKNTRLEVTHIALNDGTVEGLKHKDFPAFSVQFHPEASPGPEDANDLFDQFLHMIDSERKGSGSKCLNAQI